MMASLWQSDYHWLILKHFKVNLFIYLHLEMNLWWVVSREEGSDFGIVNFSVSHSVCTHCKGKKEMGGGLRELLEQYLNWLGIGWYFRLVTRRAWKLREFRTFLFAFTSKCSSIIVVPLFESFFKFHNNICLFVEEFMKMLLYRQDYLTSIHFLTDIPIFDGNCIAGSYRAGVAW